MFYDTLLKCCKLFGWDVTRFVPGLLILYDLKTLEPDASENRDFPCFAVLGAMNGTVNVFLTRPSVTNRCVLFRFNGYVLINFQYIIVSVRHVSF